MSIFGWLRPTHHAPIPIYHTHLNFLFIPTSFDNIYIIRRFGFVDDDALSNGATGRECCGEEHEVKLIWSITSGKQKLMFDRDTIYVSKLGLGARQKGRFSLEWNSLGFDMKINAYAAPPIRQHKEWKQFDLIINGQSFYTFSQIFELGLVSKDKVEKSLNDLTTNVTSDEDQDDIKDDKELNMNEDTEKTENTEETEENDDKIKYDDIQKREEKVVDGDEDHVKDENMTKAIIGERNNAQGEDDDIFELPTGFGKGCDVTENKKSARKKKKSQSHQVFIDSSHSDEEDDNVSTISSLLEQQNRMSDELEDEFDDVEINPNEPPTFEAIRYSITCEEQPRNEQNKSAPLSYNDVWGNIFDPFELRGPNNVEKSDREKIKETSKTTSPRSVVDGPATTNKSKPYKQKNRLFLSCVHSFTRPSKPAAESLKPASKYEEMRDNNEPIFTD